jgi:hypothetical protein
MQMQATHHGEGVVGDHETLGRRQDQLGVGAVLRRPVHVEHLDVGAIFAVNPPAGRAFPLAQHTVWG